MLAKKEEGYKGCRFLASSTGHLEGSFFHSQYSDRNSPEYSPSKERPDQLGGREAGRPPLPGCMHPVTGGGGLIPRSDPALCGLSLYLPVQGCLFEGAGQFQTSLSQGEVKWAEKSLKPPYPALHPTLVPRFPCPCPPASHLLPYFAGTGG